MTQALNFSVRDRLISVVERTLAHNSLNRAISVNDQLVDIGLTSLDMVNLLFEVEAAFDITIPAHELTVENFETIAVIEDLMTRLDLGSHADHS
jgi:acyl carrier protein